MTWIAAASVSTLPRHYVFVCDVVGVCCDDVAVAHGVVDEAQEDGFAKLSVICKR
jgi:ornithine cyclodeaminase/alanine dehydrogenase-like protein (mu-crystallin family)